MNIRQATLEDAHTIAQLNCHVQQVHADAEPTIYKQPRITADLVAYYVEALQDEACWIYLAQDGNDPVGYIRIILQIRPESLFTYERRFMLVDQMSVNPEYYGTGIANQLMDCAVRLAGQHNLNKVELGVRAWNMRAIKFYEKQSFKTADRKMQLMLE